jgi:hypothetical protein
MYTVSMAVSAEEILHRSYWYRQSPVTFSYRDAAHVGNQGLPSIIDGSGWAYLSLRLVHSWLKVSICCKTCAIVLKQVNAKDRLLVNSNTTGEIMDISLH